MQIQKTYTPETTIIAFDIHGVLFTKDYKKIAHLVWKDKRKIARLLLYIVNPFFIYDLIKLFLRKAAVEAYIVGLGRRYSGLAPLSPVGIAIANAQKPILGTIALAQQLKQHGYTLHIVSNIGETIYHDLALDHPKIFSLFDKAIVPTAGDTYRSKSDPAFFSHYVANHPHHHIIMIDDSKHSIQQALKNGCTGILFTTPEHLRITLIDKHIL